MTAMKKPCARTATTNKAPAWKTARKTSRRRSAKAGPARPLLGVGLGPVLALGLGALILGAGVAGVTWLERSNWFDRQWEQANAAFYQATVKAGLKVEDLQVTGRQRTAADVILLTTAALGAWMVVSGVAYFIVGSGEQEGLTELLQSEDQRTIVIASWAVLAVAGALSQVATTQKKVKAA